MLDNFLETNIQNKLKLFSILHMHSSISIKELSHTLKLGYSRIDTLIDELNSDFQHLAKIEKKAASFSITIYNNNDDFFQFFHSIYKNSSVLRCLKFLITNNTKTSFSKFIENEFLTKSSAYRIRQNCLDYLHSIGLDVKENRVIGAEYRVRFLIALLYCKYGIDCCNIDEQSIKFARNYILSTNQLIDMDYLEKTRNVYGYFECLLILLWKRKDYPLFFPTHTNFEKFKKLFIYEKIKNSLKTNIEPVLHIKLSENDYTYIYLAYCCTDNCIFHDTWSKEAMKQVYDIIFSDEIFTDLLKRFEDKFGKEVESSRTLRATLIYFYQKCLLELQCIIPDKRCYINSKSSQTTRTILDLLTDILDSWREANHIKYKIDESHLYYLSLQLKAILRQFAKPIPVFIVSSLIVDLEVMRLYLMRNFSEQRIVITPLLLNKQTKNVLQEKKDCIIIVQKRFEQAIHSFEFTKQNTIIPVTIEMNDCEIDTIRQAIQIHEKKAFLDFIQNHSSADNEYDT